MLEELISSSVNILLFRILFLLGYESGFVEDGQWTEGQKDRYPSIMPWQGSGWLICDVRDVYDKQARSVLTGGNLQMELGLPWCT